MKKKIVSIIAVFAILVGVLSGCMGVDVTKIATINGKDILKSEYLFYCEQIGLNATSYYTANGMSVDDLWNQQYSEEQTFGDYLKETAMDAMKEDYVLCAKAEEMGITMTTEDQDQATEQKRALMAALGGASQYNTFLDKAALTDEKVIEILQNQVLADKVKDALLANDGEDEEVSKDAVAEYYETNYYKAKHILIMNSAQEETELSEEEYKEDAKNRAQAILDQVNAGADFDKLMNENSEDTGLETNPDGYVFTDGAMVSEFENAVKELKPGETTKELVESSYGYHIIKRLELTRDDEDFTENYDQYETQYKNSIWDDMLKGIMDTANVWVDTNVQSKVDLSKMYWGSQQ